MIKTQETLEPSNYKRPFERKQKFIKYQTILNKNKIKPIKTDLNRSSGSKYYNLKDNMKKYGLSWKKQLVWRITIINQNAFENLIVDKKFKTEETKIAKKFNNFLQCKSFYCKYNSFCRQISWFEKKKKKASINLPNRYLKIYELKDAFISLKISKIPGADKITFDVIK